MKNVNHCDNNMHFTGENDKENAFLKSPLVSSMRQSFQLRNIYQLGAESVL